MIKRVSIFLFLFSVGLSIAGQDAARIKRVNTNKTEKQLNTTIVQSPSTDQKDTETPVVFDEVAHLETLIQSIELKVKTISEDKKLRKKAMKNGWFNKMELQIMAHEKKINEIKENK